jgi:hypothetical protein
VKGDVSVKVAARFFRVSEVTIIRGCKSGTFPGAFQIGDKKNTVWHIPADDILRAHPRPEEAEMRLAEWMKVFDM